jgi:parvulin-like peptidyl-prolyl isomerase
VDPAFFEAAARLKKGETSQPFQTGYGWHIVRALEEPRTVTPEFDAVRGVLAAEARREAEGRLAEKLRGEIGVRIHPERLPASKSAPARAGEGS